MVLKIVMELSIKYWIRKYQRRTIFLPINLCWVLLFEIGNATKLFLFTTHVQAIGTTEHKEVQLKQIKEFIDAAVGGVLRSGTITSSENLIVLLAGDFNSNAYDEVRFTKMKEILGNPRDLHKEFHGDNKEHTFRLGSGNASRRFDYIMAYDSIGQWTFRQS